MRTVGIIPARLQSTRLPRKLLLSETGKPLLQYTWEAACLARSLSQVIIATDSAEIAEAVRGFGGRCEMTGVHACGTDRIAEVVRRCCADADIVVNIQGDEPEIRPDQIDLLVQTLVENLDAEMATLATPIRDREQRDAPSCVKVVCATDGRALYFSRAAIPFCRDVDPNELLEAPRDAARELCTEHSALSTQHSPGEKPGFEEKTGLLSPWLLHLGLYAYRRAFLTKLTRLPASRLERLEKLE
ncbi:MAG: 3-deoxy-manno-octulosonate cytidylyltransferase, partial [Planctomycetaceae bacterium]